VGKVGRTEESEKKCYTVHFIGEHTMKIFKNLDFDDRSVVVNEAIEQISSKYSKNAEEYEWIVQVNTNDSPNSNDINIKCESFFLDISRSSEMSEMVRKTDNVIDSGDRTQKICTDCVKLQKDVQQLERRLDESIVEQRETKRMLHESLIERKKSEESHATFAKEVIDSIQLLMKTISPLHDIYRRFLIYIMRDYICRKLSKNPLDGRWRSFFDEIAYSPMDLDSLQPLTRQNIEFIRDNAHDGNEVAHGRDEYQIALAVTAVQAEGARAHWLHLYQIAFGADATEVIERNPN